MIKANFPYKNISAFCPKTPLKFGHNGHFIFLYIMSFQGKFSTYILHKNNPIIYKNKINSQNMYYILYENLMIIDFAIYKNLNWDMGQFLLTYICRKDTE